MSPSKEEIRSPKSPSSVSIDSNETRLSKEHLSSPSLTKAIQENHPTFNRTNSISPDAIPEDVEGEQQAECKVEENIKSPTPEQTIKTPAPDKVPRQLTDSQDLFSHLPMVPFSKTNKRESVMSSVSQYSGKLVEDETVELKVHRHDSEKANLRYVPGADDNGNDSPPVNPIDSEQVVDTKELANNGLEEDDEREIVTDTEDQSSIRLGKLPTESKKLLTNLDPDRTYDTKIEGSIPARSLRRPMSATPNLPQNEFGLDLVKLAKDGKRRSIQINDDLEKLMHDAHSIKSLADDFDDSNPHKNSSPPVEEKVDKETNKQSSTKLTLPEPENDVIDESTIRHSLGSKILNLHAIAPLKTTKSKSNPEPSTKRTSSLSLPPRPSIESIRHARELSSTLQLKLSTVQKELQSPKIAQQSRSQKENINDEDEYYDIGDPHVGAVPSKSVKQSIHRSGTVIKRKHNRKSKKGTQGVGQLKQFNYTTLISLLESMNGAVIGQEFNLLNIPIREKQLLEKIIDSLSRLTSDMILDGERYQAGIQRLEKALRILEGFL